jgi:lipid-A-disaccharide synthase
VRHLIKIEVVNLSNILLGRCVVPELLQENCTKEEILYYINRFLKKDDLYEKQMQGFEKVRQILGVNEQTPSANAADVIFNLIAKKQK